MKNYISNGDACDFTNLGSDILSGQAVVVGHQIGVASDIIPSGQRGSVMLEGVYELPAVISEVYVQGDELYWDDTAKNVTSVFTGNVPSGMAYLAKANGETTVKIRLERVPGEFGDITGVAAGTGLTGGGTSGDVTLNVNVGTGPNQIVKLDGSSKLPTVDGSQLTNLPAGAPPTGTVDTLAFFNDAGNLSSSTSAFFNPSTNSIAFGYMGGTITPGGRGSLAFGYTNSATIQTGSDGALAFGSALNGGMINSGAASIAAGFVNNGVITATNNASFALGYCHNGSTITATQTGSFAFGYANSGNTLLASGLGSFVGGSDAAGSSTVSGQGSFGYGSANTVSGSWSTAFGIGNIVTSSGALVIGQYAGTPGSGVTGPDPLFVAGKGTGVGSEAVAFQINKDGTTFINDPSVGGASVGWLFSLQDTATGRGTWVSGGASGSFTTVDLKTVTVVNGLITAIV